MSEKRKTLLLVLLGTLLLFLHGRLFHFICDDAFITFRYAQNFAEFGKPVYNLNEKVEGYTNFLWLVLSTILFKFSFRVEHCVDILCAGSAFVVMVSVVKGAELFNSFSVPSEEKTSPVLKARAFLPLLPLLPVLLVSASAPLAAWNQSGLETGLYTGLLCLGFVYASKLTSSLSKKDALYTGFSFALCALTRPEGMVGFAIALIVFFAIHRKNLKKTFSSFAWVSFCFASVVVPFYLWRYQYYGAPFPNTFYLKTTGVAHELRERGLHYSILALKGFGPLFALMLLTLFVPHSFFKLGMSPENKEEQQNHISGNALLWMFRLETLFLVPYVISVGGDFLGLYRFYVPLVPMASLGFYVCIMHILSRLRSVRSLAMVGSLALFMTTVYAVLQFEWGESSRHKTNPEEQSAHIEPIHWTALYAKRWGALGMWIREHSEEGDFMAIGAAGAMPYYATSKVNNLDILGLCDAYVARHGIVVGSRPGHQRRAQIEYTLSKNPVFLFEGDYDSDTRQTPKHDSVWSAKGYVWAEVKLSSYVYPIPKTFYHYFLLRKDRAEKLNGDSSLTVF